MTRDYKLFIKDIVEAIRDIEDFIGDMGYAEFLKDRKTQNAVVWQIHIVGEATKNLPESIREKYKEVPWKYMARIRDKIAHFYFGIDYEIVWKVIKEKLPGIRPTIENILKDLSEKKS
ncbi:MAG: DUF86 domain-containing protein [Nitrospirae bacterium]|nr:DUF86 domain-containing protein [Nitrospirota bacterium]MCL5976837.1 DUF86 domain-containing protein [Nitrospirota bacterium]